MPRARSVCSVAPAGPREWYRAAVGHKCRDGVPADGLGGSSSAQAGVTSSRLADMRNASRRMVPLMRSFPRLLKSTAAHRARWGIVDQGFSSLTNFAITALAARVAPPAGFGSFSVGLSLYIFLLWGARSLIGEPFLVRMTSEPFDRQRSAAGEALGAALGFGAFSGATMIVAGLVVSSSLGQVLVAIGVGIPGLLVQDSVRYVLMARGRTRSAAANDGLWFAAQSAVTLALILSGTANAASLTLAFGCAATLAAIFGCWQCGVGPAPSTGPSWVLKHKDLGIPFLLELVTVNAVPQLSLLCVAALGGVVVVGELRAAMFLMSPPTVLFSGMVLIGIPEAVRLRRRSLAGLRALVFGLAVAMSCVTAVWALLLWSIPERSGTDLLKSNWASGRHLLVPIAAFTAANAVMYGAIVGLRALEAARESLRLRIWAGPAILVSSVTGAALAGAWGAAVGIAVSSWFSALLAWIVLRRALLGARSAPGPLPNLG